MNKETIKKNFSRCAVYYDKYSDVQSECALRLLKHIEDKDFKEIIEIGCGTGNYTELLNKQFSDAQITAVDISPKMIEYAKIKLDNKLIHFHSADGEIMKLTQEFDLITSNAVFQWFENIENSFNRYKKYLKKNGVFAFSMFGPDTFKELQKALSLYKNNMSINAGFFMPKNKIEDILKSIFEQAYIIEETIKKKYPSFLELLKSIKYTGIRGDINSNISWTKGELKTLENIYIDTFGEIIATYQVFFCKTEI